MSWTMSGVCQLTRDRVHGCGCRQQIRARRGVQQQMRAWQAPGAGAVRRVDAGGFRQRRFAAVCGPGSACHAQRVTFGEDALPVDRDPCHPIRTASPGCYDHAIHLKLSRGSSSIHTRAHELEILNVPRSPVESRRGAPVEGWRERGFRRPAASPRASHSTSTALSSPRSSSSASGLPAGGLHLCGSLG